MYELQVNLEGDNVVLFRIPLFLEHTVDCTQMIPKKIDELYDWCGKHFTFDHGTQMEYIFPIITADKNFIRRQEVPDELKDVFKAAAKEAVKQEETQGTVYLLLRLKEK